MNKLELSYQESFIALCYLVSNADGNINDYESRMFEFIKVHENISEEVSLATIKKCSECLDELIFMKSMEAIIKADSKFQLKCLAWLNTMANADGFLSDDEWSIIYRIYKDELNMRLEDILSVRLPVMDYRFYFNSN